MIHAVLLLDESGSMGNVREDVVGGFNSYIETLRKEKEGDTHVSLYTFDLSGRPIVRKKFEDRPLGKVAKITEDDYIPSGATPLNDAVIETISKVKKFTKKDDEIVFITYTDGYENSSRKTSADVHELISKMEKKGWEFVYLGANQDAWAAGSALGVSGLKLGTSGTKLGTRAMFDSVANITNTARRDVSAGVYSVGEGGTLMNAYGDVDKIGETPVDEKKDDDKDNS